MHQAIISGRFSYETLCGALTLPALVALCCFVGDDSSGPAMLVRKMRRNEHPSPGHDRVVWKVEGIGRFVMIGNGFFSGEN